MTEPIKIPTPAFLRYSIIREEIWPEIYSSLPEVVYAEFKPSMGNLRKDVSILFGKSFLMKKIQNSSKGNLLFKLIDYDLPVFGLEWVDNIFTKHNKIPS